MILQLHQPLFDGAKVPITICERVFHDKHGARLEHTHFVLEVAASGLGVTIGSHPLVEQDFMTRRLVAPFGFAADRNAYVVFDT